MEVAPFGTTGIYKTWLIWLIRPNFQNGKLYVLNVWQLYVWMHNWNCYESICWRCHFCSSSVWRHQFAAFLILSFLQAIILDIKGIPIRIVFSGKPSDRITSRIISGTETKNGNRNISKQEVHLKYFICHKSKWNLLTMNDPHSTLWQ